MTEAVKINKIPFFRLLGLSRGGKKRNKRLLASLAAANLALCPPREINAELGCTPEDLVFLDSLARRPGGWLDSEFAETPQPGDQTRLAELGLIFLSRRQGKIYLSDAGRFLLSLSSVDPELLLK